MQRTPASIICRDRKGILGRAGVIKNLNEKRLLLRALFLTWKSDILISLDFKSHVLGTKGKASFKRHETKTETGHGNTVCSHSLPRTGSWPTESESLGTYSSVCQVFLMVRITWVLVRCRNFQPPPGPSPAHWVRISGAWAPACFTSPCWSGVGGGHFLDNYINI